MNSAVILGAEPVIVDTGTKLNRDRWTESVWSLVEPEDVRWIFLSHDDHDHVGNLVETLDRCVNATLVTTWFSLERLSGDMRLPLERCRWINDGERWDAGDRELVAMRPPVWDSPTTRGLFDTRSRFYWAVDGFSSMLPGHTTDVSRVGELRLDRGGGNSLRSSDLDLDVAGGRQLAKRVGGAVEKLGEIDPPALARCRMDLRREIEIVDRAKQDPRLGNDISGALPVAEVGGAEELAVDDLGETDDGVERGLDLVEISAMPSSTSGTMLSSIHPCRPVVLTPSASSAAEARAEVTVTPPYLWRPRPTRGARARPDRTTRTRAKVSARHRVEHGSPARSYLITPRAAVRV